MKKIAVFASGNGSNAQAIAEYFNQGSEARVSVILSNRKDAFVIQRAANLSIPTIVFNRSEFYDTDKITNYLIDQKTDLVVLAGFLWLIPTSLVKAFPNRIVNIHPALLPNFGGKGMYGHYVHEAVVESGNKESGITIHYVNEWYDEGQIIFQAYCPVDSNDTADSLAAKIHELEYAHFPRVINEVLKTF
jgi:phosphoribosylglycinamide formyltransferase-1